MRGKFLTVLAVRTHQAHFFQEKAGSSLGKQTAASLQNPAAALPVPTIGLFLQEDLPAVREIVPHFALKPLKRAPDRETPPSSGFTSGFWSFCSAVL